MSRRAIVSWIDVLAARQHQTIDAIQQGPGGRDVRERGSDQGNRPGALQRGDIRGVEAGPERTADHFGGRGDGDEEA
jgi:hypothetical protein